MADHLSAIQNVESKTVRYLSSQGGNGEKRQRLDQVPPGGLCQASKRPSRSKRRTTNGKPRAPLITHLDDFEASRLLMSLSQKVEGKGKATSWIHDPDTLASVRGLLDAKRTYQFRIWAAPVNATVSSNVTAGAFASSPLALPEFSGILSVLFDEYRVDHINHHIRPIAIGGSTSGFDKYAYAICNDFIATTVPTSWEVALARAESRLVPVCASSGSGFFAYETLPSGSGVNKNAWKFKPPRIFALAGTTASIGPYIDIAQSWPGAALVYAETTATNGTVTLTDWREFYLSFRMRR